MQKERLKNYGARRAVGAENVDGEFIHQVADLLCETREFFEGYFHDLVVDLQCKGSMYKLVLSDGSGTQQFTMVAGTLQSLRERFLNQVKVLRMLGRN